MNVKNGFLLFLVFLIISCTSTKYDVYKIDDGYLVAAGSSKDEEILLVDVYFSFDKCFPKGLETKEHQHSRAAEIRDYLMIDIRSFVRDFFAQYPGDKLVEILLDEDNTEIYDDFLIYLSNKKQYDNIAITSFKVKLKT